MSERKHGRIGIVVAAHAPLATALVEAARSIVGSQSLGGIGVLELGSAASPENAFEQVRETVKNVDEGHGVLVLADLFGGSAANLTLSQLGEDHLEVVTGANLAMLLEAITHRTDGSGVTALAERVARAARTSVVVASSLLGRKSGDDRIAA